MRIKFKNLKLIIIVTIIVLACFGFGKEVMATDYYATGTLTSTDLLLEKSVGSIDSFYTSSTIDSGAGESIWVQFSTSSTSGPWYDASSALDATTSVPNGQATTTLSGSLCSGDKFYYKMQFNSNTGATSTPVLDEIRVNYTEEIKYYTKKSSATSSDENWDTETEIGRDSSGFGHMSLVPMGSEKVMAIYNDYDGSNYNLKYRIYNGSWGASSTVVADCKDNTNQADWDEYHWFSAVSADASDNIHLIYVDSDDNDLNYIYYNGSSWGSAQEIYTGTVTHPSLSYDSTSGNLVAFFIEGSAVKYKVKKSGSWGDPSGGTTIKAGLDSPSYLGSAYSDDSLIGIIWQERSSSPYAISYAILTLTEARSDIIRLKGGVRLKGGLRLK